LADGRLPAAHLQRRTSGEDERAMDRDKLIDGMLTGVNPALSPDQLGAINAALKAFSDDQLTQMDAAGVRMWPNLKGLPPDIPQMHIDDLGTPAEYKYQFRVVRISPTSLATGSAVNHLRHEFAHAWDNVYSGKDLKSLRTMNPDKQADELNTRAKQPAPFASDSSDKLQKLAAAYKQILAVDREKFSFAHDSTAPKHATTNVREFYAEGYSVFHGLATDKQARMYWIARNFFAYLEEESKRLGLLPPKRELMETTLDGIDPKWRDFSK
jgi:hypothetical protein